MANGTATVSAQVTDAYGNQSALATQSVTVAETFGDDLTFTATSESTPGTTITFTPTTLSDAIAQDVLLPGTTTLSGSSDGSSVESSFDIAAEQAGDSRVYGGIYFSFSVDAGFTVGQEVGDWTLQAFNLSEDTTPPKIVINQNSGLVTNQDPTVTGEVTTILASRRSPSSLIPALRPTSCSTATGHSPSRSRCRWTVRRTGSTL